MLPSSQSDCGTFLSPLVLISIQSPVPPQRRQPLTSFLCLCEFAFSEDYIFSDWLLSVRVMFLKSVPFYCRTVFCVIDRVLYITSVHPQNNLMRELLLLLLRKLRYS